jgi:transcriptional regulator with XRE-family HTH domain
VRVPNLSRHRQAPALIALGKAIREAREAKMMSQEALSLAADVDVSYVGRVERGDNNVAILTLLKLTAALQLALAELANMANL